MKHSLPGLIVSWCVFVCSLKRKQKFHPPKQRSKENGIKFWALSRFFLCLCVTELFIFKGELKVFFVFQFISKKGNEAKQIICKYVLIFFYQGFFSCWNNVCFGCGYLYDQPLSSLCMSVYVHKLTHSKVQLQQKYGLHLKVVRPNFGTIIKEILLSAVLLYSDQINSVDYSTSVYPPQSRK